MLLIINNDSDNTKISIGEFNENSMYSDSRRDELVCSLIVTEPNAFENTKFKLESVAEIKTITIKSDDEVTTILSSIKFNSLESIRRYCVQGKTNINDTIEIRFGSR